MKHKNPIPSDLQLIIPCVNRFPEFMKFVIWYATPQQFREPETQKEFSELIGVCEDTLTDWKRKPEFWSLVQQALGDWIKEKIPDVIGGLYIRASFKGNAKEVETFLKIAGIHIKKEDKK